MASYLVTGGAGFIGSHLCEALVEKKHTVYVLDNLSTGKLKNIHEKVNFIEGDIRDYLLLLDLMSKVDGCFHLAAIASVMQSNEHPLQAHEINLTGTLNVIECTRALNNKQKNIPVVFASSSAVYGNNQTLPNQEDGLTIPISNYGAQKLCGEYYGKFTNNLYATPFTALRLFNVYGARQTLESDYSGVITIFIKNLIAGFPITFYGDGEQARDFIYVKDVVRFFIRAMETSTDSMRIYNVCSGKKTSIHTIANILGEILKIKPDIIIEPHRIGDILYNYGSPTLAKNELDILAEYSLESGLTKLLEEFQQ